MKTYKVTALRGFHAGLHRTVDAESPGEAIEKAMAGGLEVPVNAITAGAAVEVTAVPDGDKGE